MPLDMASNDASSASMESTVRVLVSFFLATDETSSARSTGATHKEKFNVPLSEDHKDLFKFQKYLKTFTGLRLAYCKHDQWSQGVLRVSSDGDDRMGAKIKTQKNPFRASNKTQKIPGQKLNPQKIPCQISEP